MEQKASVSLNYPIYSVFQLIWARDIWPMIDKLDTVQGFPSEL